MPAAKLVATLRGHESSVFSVAFSPDGKRLVSGGEYPDNSLHIWNATTGEAIGVGRDHGNTLTAVTFSPDGKMLASGSTDGTARLWDAATFAPIAELKHGCNVYKEAFSPGGTRPATACADNTIRL